MPFHLGPANTHALPAGVWPFITGLLTGAVGAWMNSLPSAALKVSEVFNTSINNQINNLIK